ncbi:transposase [Sorangium sp. So ce1128]
MDILKATTQVSVADEALDALADAVANTILAEAGNNRSAPLYTLYFGNQRPSDLKRPVLGGQLETMRAWLCRYGARPPFRLERLALLPDGRIATRLRRPRRNGATHLVLEPIAFMARLAALIPPPCSSMSGSRARRLPSRVRGARTAKRRERRRRSPLAPATPASRPTCARGAARATGSWQTRSVAQRRPTRGATTTGDWAVEGAFDVLASTLELISSNVSQGYPPGVTDIDLVLYTD